MADDDGTPRRQPVRSYDALTTPLPKYRPEDLIQPVDPEKRRELGDVPVRVVYTVLAGLVAVAVTVLVFGVFGQDEPPERVPVTQVAQAPPPSVSPSPSATPVITLPRVPASRPLIVFDGAGTPVAAMTVDEKAGITYARFGDPWQQVKPDPFQFRQRAGNAIAASGPLPGTDPGTLDDYADYRKIAARAVKWTLRYQPDDSKLTWTGSQPVRHGMGWILGYRVTYQSGGRKHSSDAIVAVISTGADKPAFLFASVPDTRAPLRRDLNMLFWTLRPL